jgi:ABC-2 type transport system ATP-binding protein
MIEIEKVTRRFGDKVAVRDLSLRIPRGEVFCMLGPNGAGKTTTMKMLCGLLQPSEGRIVIAGRDMARDGASVREVLGYIPDTPFIYDRLTPREFMEFTGDLYRLPRDRVKRESEESFRAFGLEEHADLLVKDLSHGLRQRLVYASTFLHRPEVLLVDEPFIGLDPHSIRQIKNLLRAKAGEGMTIVLTTHILALAEDIGDRIGIIAKGRLVAEGTIAQLVALSHTEGDLEDIFMRLTED